MKSDAYSRVIDQIVAELEKGVRPWHKPWNAGHVAGPISRPLRSCCKPCSGINVVMLWATAMERGYSAPIRMTAAHAVDFLYPFIGETGYRSFLDIHAEPVAGLTPDAFAEKVIASHVRGEFKGKLRKIAPECEQRVRQIWA